MSHDPMGGRVMAPFSRVRKFKPGKSDRRMSKSTVLVIERRTLTPAADVAAMFRKVAR